MEENKNSGYELTAYLRNGVHMQAAQASRAVKTPTRPVQ
jgi:hypothetical protein